MISRIQTLVNGGGYFNFANTIAHFSTIAFSQKWKDYDGSGRLAHIAYTAIQLRLSRKGENPNLP
jgi:hypothetical protein